ncbi:hypothetical protein HHI36_003618 [Cryptolaemus montrouzieri]|uniref:FAM20 C-terminal domain-containing protein n=1 Tax=Cryptolaemus montrouzieri TaxID=559131 RepID=A0ABD2PEP4_9CUCU
MNKEIVPVASKRLMDTALTINNRTCIYGRCYYCSKRDPLCADQNDNLIGAVIFNLRSSFKILRSPWMRTYKKDKKAQWEQDNSYCRTVRGSISKKRLVEMIDIAIFDFFIQNGDRHHYEIMGDKLLLLDNGKGLGNPHKHHVDILAPLYQCCMLRKKTWKKLLTLSGQKLSSYLKQMPDINNFLAKDHLEAIDNRLSLIYAAVEYCKTENKMIFI